MALKRCFPSRLIARWAFLPRGHGNSKLLEFQAPGRRSGGGPRVASGTNLDGIIGARTERLRPAPFATSATSSRMSAKDQNQTESAPLENVRVTPHGTSRDAECPRSRGKRTLWSSPRNVWVQPIGDIRMTAQSAKIRPSGAAEKMQFARTGVKVQSSRIWSLSWKYQPRAYRAGYASPSWH